MLEEPGVRFGLANGILVSALLGAGGIELRPGETMWMAVLVAGLVSIGLPLVMTASMGVIAWALVTGFVGNRCGELTLARPDLLRLLVFAVSTLGLAVFVHGLHLVLKEKRSV